jgi:MFS family permease
MTAAPADLRTYDGGLTRLQVTRWRNALFVVFGLSGLSIATWLGRVPAVRDALEASTLQMGLLVTGLSVGSILGITLSSHVIAAVGARRTVLAALVVVAVGLIGAGLSVDLGAGFVGIVICLAVFGLGNGLCDVAMNVSGAAAERVLGRTVMPRRDLQRRGRGGGRPRRRARVAARGRPRRRRGRRHAVDAVGGPRARGRR